MLPSEFWWGTTSSSTQVEGAAPASTWKRWEDLKRVPSSGDGNGFVTTFPDDFAAYAEHGLTQHRMTLEWARLEPKAGHRDGAVIEHYRHILTTARDAGIDIWAGLYHYTLPGWFADDAHGFIDDRARTYFWPRHVDFMAETFGDLVSAWVPVNEPTSCAYGGWISGEIPPGRQDPETFPKALRAMHLAGLEAWRLLRSGDQPVATAMNVSPVYPAVRSREPDERDVAGAAAARFDDLLFTTWIRALRDGILAVPGLPEEPIEELAGAYDLIGFAYDDALSVYADGSVGPYPAHAASVRSARRRGPRGSVSCCAGCTRSCPSAHSSRRPASPPRPTIPRRTSGASSSSMRSSARSSAPSPTAWTSVGSSTVPAWTPTNGAPASTSSAGCSRASAGPSPAPRWPPTGRRGAAAIQRSDPTRSDAGRRR